MKSSTKIEFHPVIFCRELLDKKNTHAFKHYILLNRICYTIFLRENETSTKQKLNRTVVYCEFP